MKQCWLYLKEWNKDLVTESIEAGIDAIICDSQYVKDIKDLGIIETISENGGDKSIPDDVELFVITNKDDENQVAKAVKSKIAVVRTTDWDIIPIENLIPLGEQNLYTFVRNGDDAKLAVGIMEKGVGGVVLETDDPQEIGRVVKIVKEINNESYDLVELEIEDVKIIGIGDRVCLDTCSNLAMGEGVLVGNSSRGMFLVHAENIENPYVAPRPFRINAGAVHSYVKVPGDKTRYLGELATGDPVTVSDFKGKTYTSYLGRSKIEKRPMLVVYAKDGEGVNHSIVLQNAETIRLTSPNGEPLSVVKLKKGDKVLGAVEKGGRHFGMAVEESIVEQ
jgi:3-dehydroquinate synthase II